jgi:hypothetical protein
MLVLELIESDSCHKPTRQPFGVPDLLSELAIEYLSGIEIGLVELNVRSEGKTSFLHKSKKPWVVIVSQLMEALCKVRHRLSLAPGVSGSGLGTPAVPQPRHEDPLS